MKSSYTLMNNASEQKITKIIIISTYFGQWPVWFPAFLLSCAKNETIQWLFFTDCEIPDITYPNIHFERMGLEQLNDLASQKLGFRVQKATYSQVDLQPAYGVIFREYIKGFDFWGHCDIDVVWGNIRSFITEDILQNYDIISPRKDFLAGHLTLWRNEPEINMLFRAVPAYREIFSSDEHHGFDEPIMSTFLKILIEAGRKELRVYWLEQMIVWFKGSITPIRWYWKTGKVFDAKHREYIYMHFQHWNKSEWKKSVSAIDFQVGDQPEKFMFTRQGIRSRRPSARDLLFEKFNWGNLKESFDKLTGEAKKFLRLLKMVLLVKDFDWSQKLVVSSIGAREVQYEWKTGRLFLKRLNFHIGKQQSYLLEGYWWIVQLVHQWNARFYCDEQDELFVEIAGLRASIQKVEDIFTLKELLVDGIYNFHFSRPAVVWDIGMNVGLASLYFAGHPDVAVIGYEPYEKQYNQALRNISLNPGLSEKIRVFNSAVGGAEFKSIAMPYAKTGDQPGLLASDNGMGPKFEHEEIEIKNAADILASIVTNYPERDIVVKIDFVNSEYHIDGISEYHLMKRLHAAGKLGLIDAIMLKWHKITSNHDPYLIARQLSDYGFRVFLFAPHNPHKGMLYATRSYSSPIVPDQKEEIQVISKERYLYL